MTNIDFPVVIFATIILLFGLLMIFAGIRIIRARQVIQIRKLIGREKKKEYPHRFHEPEVLSGEVAMKSGIIYVLFGVFCLVVGVLFLVSQIWR